MANNSASKTKLLWICKILFEETDAEHGVTMSSIIDRLAKEGISAERKSIYRDIHTLQKFGIDVRKYHRSPDEYAIATRPFSLDQLMLMVDAIQSCRAITEDQAKQLVINIKKLATNRQRKLLNRRIHVQGRITQQSDSVFANIDTIHEVMRTRRKLKFSYQRVGVDGKFHESGAVKTHTVSPVSISYEEGFYYLTAWDEDREALTEFRLDRMVNLEILRDEHATSEHQIVQTTETDPDLVRFGRFNGEKVIVTLESDPDKAGILLDRFGKAARFLKTDGSCARVRVKICKSEQFFGWIAGMGKTVRIVEPMSLVQDYKNYLRELLKE